MVVDSDALYRWREAVDAAETRIGDSDVRRALRIASEEILEAYLDSLMVHRVEEPSG